MTQTTLKNLQNVVIGSNLSSTDTNGKSLVSRKLLILGGRLTVRLRTLDAKAKCLIGQVFAQNKRLAGCCKDIKDTLTD